MPRIAAVTTLAVLLGGGAVYASAHKDVTLDVDGETTSISTFAASVGDVLAAEGITLAEHDEVTPDETAPLSDGERIVVRSANLLKLEVDGKEREVWSTALTADEALAQLSRRGSEALIVASRAAPLGRNALDLPLAPGKPVMISDAGETTVHHEEAATVGELLAKVGVTIGERDEVRLGKVTPDWAASDVVIRITRITTEQRTVTEGIPFTTVTKKDSSLLTGTRKTTTAGVPGTLERTQEVTLINGHVSQTDELSQRVVREPVNRVVVVGTKPKPKPVAKPAAKAAPKSTPKSAPKSTPKAKASSGSSAKSSGGSAIKGASAKTDSLNWAALAKCESGGNPSIVSKTGRYHGLYQFSVPTWRAVGGSGLPSKASASEQTARAKMLYERAGAGQWPVCGKNLFK